MRSYRPRLTPKQHRESQYLVAGLENRLQLRLRTLASSRSRGFSYAPEHFKTYAGFFASCSGVFSTRKSAMSFSAGEGDHAGDQPLHIRSTSAWECATSSSAKCAKRPWRGEEVVVRGLDMGADLPG
jgi:hypothetical protein